MPHIVVTGATHGIGKAIAEKFLQAGFSLSTCARNAAELRDCQSGWEKAYPGREIHTMALDMRDKENVQAFADSIQNRFGEIQVLVNNAGIFLPGKLMEEPEGRLEELMAVNVYSAYWLTRYLVSALKRSGKGHIFNISSVAGKAAYDNGGSYSMTKYALSGFSENLRHELSADSVKVTTLFPGATWSRSWEGSGLPESRFMQPSDIAEIIFSAYHLSPAANVDTVCIRPVAGDI